MSEFVNSIQSTKTMLQVIFLRTSGLQNIGWTNAIVQKMKYHPHSIQTSGQLTPLTMPGLHIALIYSSQRVMGPVLKFVWTGSGKRYNYSLRKRLIYGQEGMINKENYLYIKKFMPLVESLLSISEFS
jgi:hypothetical protein